MNSMNQTDPAIDILLRKIKKIVGLGLSQAELKEAIEQYRWERAMTVVRSQLKTMPRERIERILTQLDDNAID